MGASVTRDRRDEEPREPPSELLRAARVPSFCPICGIPMKGRQSTIAFYDHGCCDVCFIQWVEDREERWSTGWRPSPEQIKAMLDRL